MADTKEPGCGWTQERIIAEMITLSAKQYEDALKKIGMTATRRADLTSTYISGMRIAIRHLEGMGVLVVLPDSET